MKLYRPIIKTVKPVVPRIYAYTTNVQYQKGYTKIGYTEQNVNDRIKQQTQTAGIKVCKKWSDEAVFEKSKSDDKKVKRDTFTDHQFHAYLRKNGVKQPIDLGNDEVPSTRNEWFYITFEDTKKRFYEFRKNRGILEQTQAIVPYTLRSEQEEAVSKTKAYRDSHENGEFLWNAKPRFGKTLSAYDLMKRIEAKNVLIVTNRPAIANSWYDDYVKFIGEESGYLFVSGVNGIDNGKYVLSYDEYLEKSKSCEKKGLPALSLIDFVSLQDLKGSINFGGSFDKLNEIKDITWDLLIIDEAHEGVDTYKSDVAFDRINRKFTLHLSGTPFKALANNKFADDAIFNYTYADEQKMKREWDDSSETENPYAILPKLNLYTYQMSEIVRDKAKRGIDIDGETEEYAFDLNEFFRVENGKFAHEKCVEKFLKALTTQEKFPFSTEELRNELKHTFWLFDRVESAKLMAKKLKEIPLFKKGYEIVVAAGDGKIDDDDENEKSYKKVVNAIKENDKTITLSVGQLTTGVTIPEWTGVLMLSNVKSPALYMQAAFRAQNPCLFNEGGELKRKENAYVFDFDPARTLIIFEKFANDLSPKSSSGRLDIETRKENILELLNFFPVIGEDEEGKLIELDAEKVLTIPRKIKSMEVVRRGFMSNFLFQNIHNVFGAPREILDIIEKFEAIEEPKPLVKLTDEVKNDLSINDNGEVEISDEYAIGKAKDLFGEKIYGVNDVRVEYVVDKSQQSSNADSLRGFLKEFYAISFVNDTLEKVKDEYADNLKASDKRLIENKLNNGLDRFVDTKVKNYQIEINTIDKEHDKALNKRDETGKSIKEINEEFKKKKEEAAKNFQRDFANDFNDFAVEYRVDAVRTAQTRINEREKNTIEEGIRDHLRGFSRTIPSFLMAYGDDTVTLATFDTIIPGDVFLEVTSISLDEFRLLRDGRKYPDSETGEEKVFEGHLFDPVVFDDSVKQFLALKKKLANYFDEKTIEDIFDYIPPQKTNQIFTPKDVVKDMVDKLEKESPGCFDDKDHTFIDLYMKSGLYITEIVKRLYQSEKMKKEFPDGKERLKHIFEKQVFGLAPTEIIYKIATNFILGFEDDIGEIKHNFRQLDAVPYVKEGTLEKKLEELYGKDHPELL